MPKRDDRYAPLKGTDQRIVFDAIKELEKADTYGTADEKLHSAAVMGVGYATLYCHVMTQMPEWSDQKLIQTVSNLCTVGYVRYKNVGKEKRRMENRRFRIASKAHRDKMLASKDLPKGQRPNPCMGTLPENWKEIPWKGPDLDPQERLELADDWYEDLLPGGKGELGPPLEPLEHPYSYSLRPATRPLTITMETATIDAMEKVAVSRGITFNDAVIESLTHFVEKVPHRYKGYRTLEEVQTNLAERLHNVEAELEEVPRQSMIRGLAAGFVGACILVGAAWVIL